MTQYAIMRFTKLKTFGSIGASLQHNFRERETKNADPERTKLNEHEGAKSTSEAMGLLRSKLPEKYRKDAVLAIEYMMTASPQWFEKATPKMQEEFFNRSKEWLTNKFGKDNLVLTTIHRDESTPHMAAYVVPINDKGRLSAYSFTGQRQLLRNDQTTFAKKMKDLGLVRGIEGSKAQHKSIQQFYREITPPEFPKISPEDLKKQKKGALSRESDFEAAERINVKVRDFVVANQIKTAQNQSYEAKLVAMEKTLEKERKENNENASKLKKLQSLFKNLSQEQIKEIDEIVKSANSPKKDNKSVVSRPEKVDHYRNK